VAWWCDPTIDLSLHGRPPASFGRQWPAGEDTLRVDEVAFYASDAVWRAARTATGPRWVMIEDAAEGEPHTHQARIAYTPARLHGSARFAAATTERGSIRVREWHVPDGILGFTIAQEER
jgi:hypothetical protein